jgi:hypothetical protein
MSNFEQKILLSLNHFLYIIQESFYWPTNQSFMRIVVIPLETVFSV